MSNINKDIIVWVLIDERPGNANQALGVAEALGYPFVTKEIHYKKTSRLPNFLKLVSGLGVTKASKDILQPPWPDIVIAAGRKTAPISRYIKRKSKGKCFAVQLMWPGAPLGDIDLVAVPQHDISVPESKRVIRTLGSPHRLNSGFLEQESAMWRGTLQDLPEPRIGLLLGGDTKKGKFTAEHSKKLAEFASGLTKKTGGSLLVTTSRRTNDDAKKALKNALDCRVHFHDLDRERANPYYAIMAMSKAIIVTGDSISMCSEACYTGKPVFIYAPKEVLPDKHQRFYRMLIDKDFAMPVHEGDDMVNFAAMHLHNSETKHIEALDVAGKIADEIRLRLDAA